MNLIRWIYDWIELLKVERYNKRVARKIREAKKALKDAEEYNRQLEIKIEAHNRRVREIRGL